MAVCPVMLTLLLWHECWFEYKHHLV